MPKKIDQYGPERLEVLNKIFQIINITDANNMFSLHKVDNDKAVQDALMGLESDIKKYFICSEWSCFKKKDIVKRRWLSMIKYVVKEMGYNFVSMQLKSNADGFKYVDTMYSINVKNKV
jgi:hypothetical protein